MTSSLDNFALSFDSIKVDRSTAPPPEAFDHALAIVAPPAALDVDIEAAPAPAPQLTEPGFYLVDDAQGRFAIDQTSGVITLKDDAVLTREFGAVHEAHIKVVEISGAFYDMKFRLRLTGRVPQMQGCEEDDALAALTATPLPETPTPEIVMPSAPIAIPETPAQPWLAFNAIGGVTRKAALHGETAAFGTLFAGPVLPACDLDADLNVEDALPPPSSAIAAWATEA